jgi:hypothetical protein
MTEAMKKEKKKTQELLMVRDPFIRGPTTREDRASNLQQNTGYTPAAPAEKVKKRGRGKRACVGG